MLFVLDPLKSPHISVSMLQVLFELSRVDLVFKWIILNAMAVFKILNKLSLIAIVCLWVEYLTIPMFFPIQILPFINVLRSNLNSISIFVSFIWFFVSFGALANIRLTR
jgi:hypothetical protein